MPAELETISRLQLPCPAKINLFLHIVGRRPDGYHLLETAFQFLDLGEQVTLETTGGTGLERQDNHDFPLPREDLTIRAARELAKAAGMESPPATRITLEKIIPPGSGLGGGSSNAATVLMGLNRLWGCNLPQETI